MRARTVAAVAALALLLAAPLSAEPVRIGIVADGPWTRNNDIRGIFQSEIEALTSGEFEVTYPDAIQKTGDWTPASVRAGIEALFDDPGCDIILALGVIASSEASRFTDYPKPVVAPFIVDANLQGMRVEDGGSGVKNFAWITSPFSLERDLSFFHQVHPFRHLAFLSTGALLDGIPELRAALDEAAGPLGVEVTYIPVSDDPEAALAMLPDSADAAYFTGMMQMNTAQSQALIDGINERRIPSFALLGWEDVERGALFGLASDVVWPRFARRTALILQRIMRGEEPGQLPVAFSGGERLAVNMRTARRIGFYPSWGVLTEAHLVDDEKKEVAETWDLGRVMTAARTVNLVLAVAQKTVEAAEEEVGVAQGPLLPQVSIGGTALMVDQDVAAASFGQQPERSIEGNASLTQVIYSERAWAGYSIEKHTRDAVGHDRDATLLDVTLESATAFFNVLRAKTQERVVRRNLTLTRENLEMARIRQRVGMAAPQEVFRWESQIASDRNTVVNASARRNVAEIDFNRVLLRPLEERFATVETGIEDPALLNRHSVVMEYIDNPWTFRVFRSFMSEEALRQSPELAAIDAAIEGQSRFRSATTRVFFLPDVALFGNIDHRFWADGEGSTRPVLVPSPQDTRWNVGVELSLPLLTGGSRLAERRQAGADLERLRIQRHDTAQRVEQRMRSALHLLGASRAGMQHTRDAADAAVKTLDVVSDMYSRGAISIIDLLDAQNNAFIASLDAADAIYDFFVDLMEAERAYGVVQFFSTDEVRTSFHQRLQEYFEIHGSPTAPDGGNE